MIKMFTEKKGGLFSRYLIAFCVITTVLCLAEGILGSLLMPDSRLPFSAFFVPPCFGLLTSLTGIVVESRRVLSTWETVLRLVLQWLLIMGIVFGVNLCLGYIFTPFMAGIVAAEVTVIFVLVYLIMWLNERRIANAFNRELASLQMETRTAHSLTTSKKN